MKPTPNGWPQISSSLYYPDANAAIAWLCNAFGFEVRLKIDGPDNTVAHSELTFGRGVIMVSGGGKQSDAVKAHLQPPTAAGGMNTQNLFVYVDDIDAHHARAVAAGATDATLPSDVDYGEGYWADRGYGAKDIGGHSWWFAQRIRG